MPINIFTKILIDFKILHQSKNLFQMTSIFRTNKFIKSLYLPANYRQNEN
jgi:hypothetical protein